MKKLRAIVQFFGLALLVASLAAIYVLWNNLTDAKRTYQQWSASIDRVEVVRTEGGLLQVSSIRSPEAFTATKPHSILGLDLGATVTHIRVPATFNYHIELAREWKVRIRPDGAVVVIAPAVKPTLPVAIDTSRLESHAEGRWALLTGTAELDALQRKITAELALKASLPSYINFQREAARATVTEFVRKWLLTQDRWKSVRGSKVNVYFADEPIGKLPDFSLPSIRLEP